MFYWIALLVASCLAGCRSHSGETDMQTRMRTEIVTNVRDSVLPFGWIMQWLPTAVLWNCIAEWYSGSGCSERRGSECPDSVEFSAAYRTFKDEAYLKLADKSQRYFIDTFIDKEHGGVYWLVNPDGEVLNASKYTYAMTYAIYGLAEHYLATGNSESLDMAVGLYHTLEEKGREPQYDGYVESFTEDWKQLDNYDNNASKTMNAHLHVLEAYTLYINAGKTTD